jgi:hypothetical protein
VSWFSESIEDFLACHAGGRGFKSRLSRHEFLHA